MAESAWKPLDLEMEELNINIEQATMTNNIPLVTVIMTTYNHEKYVGEAIESVLKQTFDDIELVIVNDGSGDNTEKVIKKFTDERIVYLYQENQGPSIAANNAILASRGKYIAIMSGDDVSHPLRIERQLREYQKQNNKRVLFSHCNFIDDDNNSLDGGHFAKEFFNYATKNRFEILNHYFWKGNFLNDITTFTEKEAFLDIGLYNPLFLQLQDFDLWMRALLKGYDFYIMPEKLISYRIRANNANLSAPSAEAIIRTTLENGLILRNYLQIKTQDDLLKIFPEVIKFNSKIEPDLIPFYIAQLSLSVPKSCHQLFGVETLFNLLNDPVLSVQLKEKVGFGHKEFCEITGRQDIFRLFHNWLSKLYVNTGDDFSEKEVVSQHINLALGVFSLTFDLSKYSNIQSLRWDPMENQWCKVTIEDMCCLDKAGNKHTIDKHLLRSNGIPSNNGTIVFETFDPNIFIPVQGDVKHLSITGKWEIISFGKIEQSINDKNALADKLSSELKNIYDSRGWKVLMFFRKMKNKFIAPSTSAQDKDAPFMRKMFLILKRILKKRTRNVYGNCDCPPSDGLDIYGDLVVSGWAIAHKGISKIEVYCDNAPLGDAFYGILRSDVKNTYPSIADSEKSGFSFPISNLAVGLHTLTIKMITKKGKAETLSRRIHVKQSDSNGGTIGKYRKIKISKTKPPIMKKTVLETVFTKTDSMRIGHTLKDLKLELLNSIKSASI